MLPNYARWFRGEGIWATCEKAKELGMDALCLVDHVMVMLTPRQYVSYGNRYMDIWTAMSYIAAVTNAQGGKPIMTQAVVVIPYRPPIQQAKVIATVDSLPGGRVMVGAGSGYNENEFFSLWLNVRERGNMTDENLACMKELWTHPVSSFHGKYVNFDEMTISVRPAQQPHPPSICGSHGPRPRRRIAEKYQGCFASPGRNADSQRAFESDMADLNRLWKENGRSGKPYLMAMTIWHLTTDCGQAGQVVVKGILPGGRYFADDYRIRLPEGQERAHFDTYRITHVDEVVQDLRRQADAEVDLAVACFPFYRYGGLDNLGLQLQQMEVFDEHVLPKISRDKKPV